MQRIIIQSKSMLNRIHWGGWYFIKVQFKFCIVLYYFPLGEKHVDSHGPTGLLQLPQDPNYCLNQSVTKSKAFMYCCWFVYSFIYLFWNHQCTEVLHDALNKEFHEACLLSHIVHQEPFAGNCARSFDCWPSGVALASES